jgi:transposase
MNGDTPKRKSRGKAAGGKAGRRLGGQAAAAFVAALEQGATVRAAAAAAGCSAGTCYNRRRKDPAFRAAWDEAAAKGNRPWLIATKNGRRLQKWKPRGVKFTVERKEIYLAHFAATCDSDEAARLSGVGDTTVYTHRRTDPEFALAWSEALDQGFARLVAELARQRLEALKRFAAAIDKAEADPERAVEFERALKLLNRYDTRRGRPEPIVRPRGGAQRPSFAEGIARLEQRLKALGYEIDEEAVPPRADDAEAA